MVEASRRPTVRNPAPKKQRAITLERVTMRPRAAVKVVSKGATSQASWRVVQGVAAAALIAAVPLAHAASPDPTSPFDDGPSSPSALHVALAPEPLDPEPSLRIVPGLGADGSVADIAVFSKLEGIKANPYDRMATSPRIGRARLVRKAPSDAGPEKVSELKANPYD